MPIRVEAMGAGERRRSAAEWEQAIEVLQQRGSDAIVKQDPAAYRQVWRIPDEWEDSQRRYEGHRVLCELLRRIASREPKVWAAYYLEAAEELLHLLEENPLEPFYWNALAVILYELNAVPQAERLFRLVSTFDPHWESLRENLKACAERKRKPIRSSVFPKPQQLRIKRLAGRAVKRAQRVRLPKPEDYRLSLVMIVKDEEEMLPACLDSVKDVVDEMIIVDTGSSDNTKQIAASYGAKVYDFAWNGSFADARNYSLEQATGDWILHLDADERLAEGEGKRLRACLARPWREAFSLVEVNYTGSSGADQAVTHQPVRLWRNRPHYRFEGTIHEEKTHTMPLHLPERLEHTSIRIIHYGYLKERIASRDKHRRNIELLKVEARNTPTAFNRFNLGTEFLALEDYETARAYLDEAWAKVRAEEPQQWMNIGYVPMLAQRAAEARRRCNDLDGAEQVIQEALVHMPEHTDLVFEQALCARDRGDLESALERADRCLEMGDAPARYGGIVGRGTHLALTLKAELYQSFGDHAKAVELWRKSLAEHPDYSVPLAPLAAAMLRSGADPEAVLEELRPHLQGRLTSAGALVATVLAELGALSQARSLFEQILAQAPSHPLARLGMVECAIADRQAEQVVEICSQLQEADPCANILARFLLRALLALGQVEEAQARLEAVHPLLHPDQQAPVYQAWVRTASGDQPGPLPAHSVTECLDALDTLLRLHAFQVAEQLIGIYQQTDLAEQERGHLLAQAYFRRGFLQSAAEEWLMLLDRYGMRADWVLGLAQIAFAEQRPDEARALAEDALTLDPHHQEAQRFLTRLQARDQLTPST